MQAFTSADTCWVPLSTVLSARDGKQKDMTLAHEMPQSSGEDQGKTQGQ